MFVVDIAVERRDPCERSHLRRSQGVCLRVSRSGEGETTANSLIGGGCGGFVFTNGGRKSKKKPPRLEVRGLGGKDEVRMLTFAL